MKLININSLCAAAENGHLSVVELLLEAGANCCAVDTARMTPLHYACMGGSEPCAKLLLESSSSVSVDAKDISGCTPLVYCLNHKSRSMEKVRICCLFVCNRLATKVSKLVYRQFSAMG